MRSTVPMRTAKIGCYIVSALQLALGVILIAAPELSANVLCYLLGACLLVTGITRIIGYLSRDLYRLAFQFDLAFGILTAAIGLLLLLRPKAVINLVLLVCGILILTDGLFKIQIALDARGFGIRRWWLILMAAVAAGGFGLLLIVLGIAYLVSRSTNASFNIWGILWPTVLLGLGVSSAIKHRSVFFLGVAGMGFYYLLFNLGNKMPFEMSWSIVIPFALILFGVDTVLKKLFPSFWGRDDGGHWDGGKRAVRSFSCENGFVSCSTVVGENILGAEPCDITGGRIKTAFGHCVLDLSACTFAPETHFSIETSFGSLELILPRNVRVNSGVEAAFGGVETKGHPDSADAILNLCGSTAFGATQIRYN